jgi:hypothetical protein
MSGAVEFLAGFGTGYMNQTQRKKDEERRDRIEKEEREARQRQDQRSQESHDMQIGELRANRDLRVSLADAAKPREVVEGAGGMVRPDTMDNRDVGLVENSSQPNNGLLPVAARVGTRGFDNSQQAQKFAEQQNSQDAVLQRQASAYTQAGRPAEAMALDKQRREYAKWLEDEGVIQAVRAARRNDPQAVYDAFNKGENRPTELPKIEVIDRDVPGIGKIKDHVVTMKVKAPDGSIQEVKKSAFDMTMEIAPFEKELALAEKGQAQANSDRDFRLREKQANDKSEYNSVMLDIKRQQVQQAGEIAAARIDAANARAAASGQKGLTMEGVQKFNDGLFKSATEYMNPKEAGTPEERQKALEGASRLATVGTNIYMSAFERGIPITQTEALEAAKLAGDNKNLVGRKGADGHIYAGVLVQGKFIPTGAKATPQQPSEQAPAAPQARPTSTPVAAQQGTIRRSGDQIIGPLTPMSVIRSEAQRGNPAAIQKIQQINQQLSENSSVMYNTGTE